MFTESDYEKLHQIMAESPEKEELLTRLLHSHRMDISTISHEIRNPLTLIYLSLIHIYCNSGFLSIINFLQQRLVNVSLSDSPVFRDHFHCFFFLNPLIHIIIHMLSLIHI